LQITIKEDPLMRPVLRSPLFLAALLACFAIPLLAQESVTESSTGKTFPASISISHGGKSYQLQCTGVAVRKKVVFKVYGMAHYMQDPVKAGEKEAITQVLTDGKAKQIHMIFVRDVDAASIQNAYRDGFKENATKEELASLTPTIEKFVGNFSAGVKENDQYILRWFPGGTVVPVIQGVEKEAITNPVFARVLWTIWFGEDSIVDPEDLVARMAQ
jgi:hypothetical protein